MQKASIRRATVWRRSISVAWKASISTRFPRSTSTDALCNSHELTEQTREAVEAQFLFPSRMTRSPNISTRQYARIVKSWVARIGLDPGDYGTHSMRRTKATLIYRRTKNLRAVQLLLGRTKLESTVGYLGIEVDDVLEMSEQTEV
ncbi:MAG: tyrosine-type recombinase/integrase [Chromatiales bacterium]